MQRLQARSLATVACSTRWRSRTLGMGSLLGSLLLGACSGGGTSTPLEVTDGDGKDGPIDSMATVPGDGDSEFVSSVGEAGGGSRDALSGDSASGAAGSGGSGSVAPPATPGNAAQDSDGGGEAARVISEADILQLSGDRLYALSRYNGLTIVDVSDPAALRLEGTYATAAEPFEMYIEDGIVFAMFNGWYSYECDTNNVCNWQTSSRMQALDTRDPDSIQLLSDTVIPGSIADSRRVGDVVYVATQQFNYCWMCDADQNTMLTSFNVATPGRIVQADQLKLPVPANAYAGARSISVTDQRIYISGQVYSNNGGVQPGEIQVVDISDASGALVEGATFAVAGPIQSRWQMDEYEGIFRVVSQPGGWGTNQPPVVQTFRVNSSSDIQPAASLPIQLPLPNEILQSVRFDGTRAYAITAERRDPLFTFDLSNPDQPRQVGELEMPGFVYHMEPRGNLVYALGFDSENPDGSLNVSLFDVADLAAPALLSRVAFGGDWGSFAEDQNRIHKAFTIMEDQGLILVPFSGGSYAEDNCAYEYGSGIQLIDIGQNTLARRGVAPQVGDARRAFLHRDHLIGVGDNTVQTFDIANRDAPVATGKLDVARNIGTVRVMDDHLLRFGSDWSTKQTILDMTPLEKAKAAQPDAEIDLSALFGDDAWSCAGGAYWGGQVFTRGDYAYVPRYSYSYDENYENYQQKLTFYIVDLSDRGAPRAVGSFTGSLSNAYGGGLEIVQTEDALLIGRTEGQYQYSQINGQILERPRFYYDVFELSDPTAPTLASTFQVPELINGGGWGRFIGGCSMDMGWGWYGGYYSSGNVALSSGDLVVSQHSERVPGSDYLVKYFLDRIDVSDPYAPVMLPKINIPGTAVHFNAGTGELVTVDYSLEREPGTSWDDCYQRGYYGEFIESTRECNVMRRSINSLVVSGTRAVRKSQLELDRTRRTTNIAVSDSRIFYTTGNFPSYPSYYGGAVTDVGVSSGDSTVEQTPISSVTLESLRLENGTLTRLPSVDLRRQNQYYDYGVLYARGDRAFSIYDQTVTVVDTEQLMTPRRLTHEIPGWGCNSLEVGGDTAYCAVGQRGVEVIDLNQVR
ncbi:MAG TPA: beta-propeller domain-containing protein [Polyangiaceae bacterium]|nr:beta-propeller domain-containing protein [Polyangiaceae bacterium]